MSYEFASTFLNIAFANGHRLDLTKTRPPVTTDRCPLTANAVQFGLFRGRSTVCRLRSGGQKVASLAHSKSNSKGVRQRDYLYGVVTYNILLLIHFQDITKPAQTHPLPNEFYTWTWRLSYYHLDG